MSGFKAAVVKKVELMDSKILLALLTVLFVAVTYISVFKPIYGNIPFTIVLPILVLLSLDLVFFEKLKLSTLVIIRVLILLPIFGLWAGESFVKVVLPFMGINILEACLVDFKRKKYFNALTGIGLIITLLLMNSSWWGYYYTNYAVGADGQVAVFATWIWAIVYTFWNFYFVATEFKGGIAFLHLGILATPIILALVLGAEYWMVMRAYSLTFGGGVVHIYFKDFFEEKFTSPRWEAFIEKLLANKMQMILMLVNLGLLVLMLFRV